MEGQQDRLSHDQYLSRLDQQLSDQEIAEMLAYRHGYNETVLPSQRLGPLRPEFINPNVVPVRTVVAEGAATTEAQFMARQAEIAAEAERMARQEAVAEQLAEVIDFELRSALRPAAR